jgi:hypothetical protein
LNDCLRSFGLECPHETEHNGAGRKVHDQDVGTATDAVVVQFPRLPVVAGQSETLALLGRENLARKQLGASKQQK